MKIRLSELRNVIFSVLSEAPNGAWSRRSYASGKIAIPTVSALALWKNEILGQLSDGAWENTSPHGHWMYWSNMTPVLGRPQTIATTYPDKSSYNLNKLIEYVGDRMLKIGQMAKAANSADVARGAAEYMPATYEEFIQSKESGKWKYDFVGDYMKDVTPEIAQKFYQTSYTMQDLKRDLMGIKLAMKNVKIANNASDVDAEPAPEPASQTGSEKSYKIYGKKGSAPAHTRFKGKAYVAAPDTRFKSGDSAHVKPSDGKLQVKSTSDDRTQVWEPEE